MIRRKVLAYVTHADRLLVFRHVDHPDAGLQVPGGTVEAGEACEAAVRREVAEEAGLTDLGKPRLVGMREIREVGSEKGVILRRRFYHLVCRETPAERWRHVEEHASDGSGPLVFEFWWVPLPGGVPPLAGGQDEFIPAVIKKTRSGS
jgi:ADP-ribose pyrophosphatase YjhB (NUDIX family)